MNLYKSFTNNEFYGAASKLEKKTKKQNCQMNCRIACSSERPIVHRKGHTSMQTEQWVGPIEGSCTEGGGSAGLPKVWVGSPTKQDPPSSPCECSRQVKLQEIFV